MPTVMFVVTTPFAVNAFLANHIDALSKDYRVVLCTNLDAYELLPELWNRVEVRHIPLIRKISPVNDLKNLLELIWFAHKIKPAAIHSITPKAGLLAMLAGFFAGVPNRWHTFTGQVWDTKRGLARGLLKGVDRLIVRFSTRVFTESKTQCLLLTDEGIVSHGKIGVLGRGHIAGVNLNRFRPDVVNRNKTREKYIIAEDTCVFLFVGRLAKDKGVFDLIQAFLKVSQALQAVELWVVGPDEEGLLPELQKAAWDYKLPIKWLGATKTPEHFMVSADVLLLPSYREGFNTTIIEAAACGIPAIAYEVEGVKDGLIHGVTGLFAEVGKPIAFSSAMKLLAIDKDLRIRLGHQAREQAVNKFCSERVTQAWLEFYRSQLNKLDEATC